MQHINNYILKEIINSGSEYVENAPMRKFTSFRTGGNADILVFPKNEDEFVKLSKLCRTCGTPVAIIGNGSNLLVSDNGIRGVVISTSKLCDIKDDDEHTFTAGAGLPLKHFCRHALERSLTGLEFAFGIPGSVGGAAYMNAGAYDGEMKDVILCCRHVDSDGQIAKLTNEQLDFSYRRSVYSDSDKWILSVTVRLKKGDREEIESKMQELMSRRIEKQPLDYPSAGSTFKRPAGSYASYLIDQCGLKGMSVGGAAVSEKHAGFIINKDNATSDDIYSLIIRVREEVYKKTGFVLEPEIKIIGDWRHRNDLLK